MYYSLEGTEVVAIQDCDVLEWAKQFEVAKRKLATETLIRKPYGKANSPMGRKLNHLRKQHPRVFISTVFLGLDHNHWGGEPLVFETMVFPLGDWIELEMRRYPTYADAMQGHLELVNKYK